MASSLHKLSVVEAGNASLGQAGAKFINDTATTEIYTLSLHDALPILDYIRFRQLQIID